MIRAWFLLILKENSKRLSESKSVSQDQNVTNVKTCQIIKKDKGDRRLIFHRSGYDIQPARYGAFLFALPLLPPPGLCFPPAGPIVPPEPCLFTHWCTVCYKHWIIELSSSAHLSRHTAFIHPRPLPPPRLFSWKKTKSWVMEIGYERVMLLIGEEGRPHLHLTSVVSFGCCCQTCHEETVDRQTDMQTDRWMKLLNHVFFILLSRLRRTSRFSVCVNKQKSIVSVSVMCNHGS